MLHGDASATRTGRRTWCRRVVVLLLASATLLPGGCVRRRLNVRSNPPGALVYVDNQQIGTTPCSVDFVYYGTREIRLVKPGYETLTVNQPIPTPWYQIPPLDFISENLTPQNIQDHRTVAFELQPQVIVPTEQLLERADQLRQETMQGAVVPASANVPPSIVVPGGPFGAPPASVTPGPFVAPPAPDPIALPPSTTAPPTPFSPPATTAPLFSSPEPSPAQPFGPQQGTTIVSPPLR